MMPTKIKAYVIKSGSRVWSERIPTKNPRDMHEYVRIDKFTDLFIICEKLADICRIAKHVDIEIIRKEALLALKEYDGSKIAATTGKDSK